jgi:hypothetical protein
LNLFVTWKSAQKWLAYGLHSTVGCFLFCLHDYDTWLSHIKILLVYWQWDWLGNCAADPNTIIQLVLKGEVIVARRWSRTLGHQLVEGFSVKEAGKDHSHVVTPQAPHVTVGRQASRHQLLANHLRLHASR